MNNDSLVFSLLRALLPFLGGFLASKGIMNSDDVNTIGGAVIAASSTVWSIVANKSRKEKK